MRLSWHRWSRRSGWLRSSNEALAKWLADHDPVAVPLEEVPPDVDPWQIEKQWIERLSPYGLYNILGNPARSPKRRDGHPALTAAA